MPKSKVKITEALLKQLVANNGQVYSEHPDNDGDLWVDASGIPLGTKEGLLLKTEEQAEKHIRYATATAAILALHKKRRDGVLQPSPSTTAPVVVIRLLLMDRLRQQVVLIQHAGQWMLPCGLLPDATQPYDFLVSLVSRFLPEAARTALFASIDQNEPKPVAWIYPPASVLPSATKVLQMVYLLTLSPDMLENHALTRFWPLTTLPEHCFLLEPVIIQAVRFAESQSALPIDERPVYTIEDVCFKHYETVVVVGGGEYAESVQEYIGQAGKVMGITHTWPQWFCLVLNDGRRIAVRPHHIEVR